jgi:hypothetical protein
MITAAAAAANNGGKIQLIPRIGILGAPRATVF